MRNQLSNNTWPLNPWTLTQTHRKEGSRGERSRGHKHQKDSSKLAPRLWCKAAFQAHLNMCQRKYTIGEKVNKAFLVINERICYSRKQKPLLRFLNVQMYNCIYIDILLKYHFYDTAKESTEFYPQNQQTLIHSILWYMYRLLIL